MMPKDQAATITELNRWPLAGLTGRTDQEVRLLTVEHPPGLHTPPHRHPGWLVAYVLEGPVVSQMEGEAPRIYQTGEWWFEPRGRLHLDAGNDDPAKTTKILVFAVTGTDDPVLVPEHDGQA
jgi:quercetin dioxygenase-like cupin family protein